MSESFDMGTGTGDTVTLELRDLESIKEWQAYKLEQREADSEAAREVWSTLSQIDVNKHVEKKNGLTYLSWAWAYATMMNEFPSFDYKWLHDKHHGDGTMTVCAEVSVMHEGRKVSRIMWLPVLNYANKPIPNPSAFEVNTARMRCLTKAMSMLGLGAYIYAGEDTAYIFEKDASASTRRAEAANTNESTEAVPVEPVAGLGDEEEASDMASVMVEYAKTKCQSAADLGNYWKANVKIVNLIDQNYPMVYDTLKKGFSEARKALETKGGK